MAFPITLAHVSFMQYMYLLCTVDRFVMFDIIVCAHCLFISHIISTAYYSDKGPFKCYVTQMGVGGGV